LYLLAQENQGDISKSPVFTFRKYCSRCHGDEGKAYGKDFANMKDNELKKLIEDMMFGPASLTPKEIEIEAMTAYHKSLKDKKPFAVALNSKSFLNGKENSLIISASPESKIKTHPENNVKIVQGEDNWKIFYDPTMIKKIEIIVTKNNVSSAFSFPDKLWTE
jgi:hypothetical protein